MKSDLKYREEHKRLKYQNEKESNLSKEEPPDITS
jgi:hypothetical protein